MRTSVSGSLGKSAGMMDHLSTLLVHCKADDSLLQTFEDFQERHVNFDIPAHQERSFYLAAGAAKRLGKKEHVQRYCRQHFNWFKERPVSDQWGRLTVSALSDPDQYLRQICVGAEGPIDRGNNSLRLILVWAKIEWKKVC